jgi:cytoskeletal protein CcmA (bactofilin family)
MFEMAKYNENELTSNNINLIGQGTEITGDITCSGDLRIDGILTGNISSKGKVVVGETGKIKGEISCKNSDISGLIEGKVTVLELLSLKTTAKVNGDITTSKLAIEPGSRFTGYCNMSFENEKIIE